MAEIKLKIASVVIGSGEGGGSGVAPYYADLPDKPRINGKTLSGNKTTKDLGLASSEQSVPSGGTTGQVLTKRSNLSNDVEWAPSSGIIGANANNLDAGSNATASIDENHILQLGIPVGKNAVNPFKGWFTTANIPTTGQEGDYCYVDDDGTTKVWRWNPNTEPPAFEETADTPDTDHTQSFASNESVNQVAIDDSHLVNPVNTADATQPVLAQAEDVMDLKAKLEGVTASEVKVQLFTSGEGQNVYDGYINGDTGAYVKSSYNKFIVVPLNGAKSVRWLGKENTSNASYLGWAFGTFSGEIDGTLSTFTALSKGVYGNNSLDNQAVEYVKNATEGATHAVITIWIYKSGGGSAVTMDNFYCYLQSGDTVKDIINELDDKLYGYNIIDTFNTSLNVLWGFVKSPDAEDLVTYNTTDYILKQTTPNPSYVNNVTSYHGKKIRITAGQYDAYYAFSKKAWNSLGSYLTLQDAIDNDMFSEVHHTNDGWVNCFKINAGETVVVDIPSDAYGIYLVGKIIRSNDYGQESISRLPSQIEILEPNGDITKLNKAIDELNDDVDSINQSITTLDDEIYGEEKEVNVDGFVYSKEVKMNIDSSYLYVYSKTDKTHLSRVYEIPIEDYESIEITPNSEYSTTFFITKRKVENTKESTLNISSQTMANSYIASDCDGYEVDSSGYRMRVYPEGSEYTPSGKQTIQLSSEAKYLYVNKYYASGSVRDYTPSSIILKGKKREGGIIEEIANSDSSALISLKQGYIDDKGDWVESDEFVTTNPLPMSRGIYVEVKEPYRVNCVMMFDNNGKLVNPMDYYYSNAHEGGMFYSNDVTLSQFNLRIRIGTSINKSSVSKDDDIIAKFAFLDDARLTRINPSDAGAASVFSIAKRRSRLLANVVYKPLENMYIAGYPDRAKKGFTMRGMPYSGASEYTKQVGQHVSMRTFLTSILNRRSVIYTEIIRVSSNVSKYGISYHGDDSLAGGYYGTVCSGLVCYVEGLKYINMSGNVPNTTTIVHGYNTSPEKYYPLVDGVDPFDLIEPLDIVRYTNGGHTTIVTDVIYDNDGERQFVVITEQTQPRAVSRAYTREMFKSRVVGVMTSKAERRDWYINRYTLWGDGLSEPEKILSVQRNWIDYAPQETLSIDPDIQCFAGDYAAFPIGNPNQIEDVWNNNKMFLNIHRNGVDGFTHLQIFPEETELYEEPIELTIKDSDSSEYVSSTDNIYSDDASDKDDWIKFDLASYWYANQSALTGKFKARVVRKEESEIVSESGFAHFEMIDLTFDVDRYSDRIECSFGSTYGTPFLIQQELRNGQQGGSSMTIDLDDTDVLAGTKEINWTDFSLYKYVKLFVRGEYGTVVRRIDVSAKQIQ